MNKISISLFMLVFIFPVVRLNLTVLRHIAISIRRTVEVLVHDSHRPDGSHKEPTI
jgi:hypothetical protein